MGTNFYLVPSCPYSIISVFPVFSVHFFLSTISLTQSLGQTLINVLNGISAVNCGKKVKPILKNECVKSSFDLQDTLVSSIVSVF